MLGCAAQSVIDLDQQAIAWFCRAILDMFCDMACVGHHGFGIKLQMTRPLSDRPTPLSLRSRIAFGGAAIRGPGKADLPPAIRDIGSNAPVGRSISISDKRAWMRVAALDAGCFPWPRQVQVLALALGLTGLAPALAHADPVTLFAAASMTTALAEIETGFEAATGHDLIVSLAGSSVLAQQIRQGAPADIFISASPDWMDLIAAEGLIEPDGRFDLVGNSLVLIAHGVGAAPVEIAPGFDLAARLGDGRLAMALVDAVPAGIYGKAALDHFGLWDGVADRVAQTDNVRAALALVALGEAPYGIVYVTDASAEDNVTIIATFPPDSHPAIVYPLADLVGRDTPAEAAFIAYLRGDEARAAFARQGFVVLDN